MYDNRQRFFDAIITNKITKIVAIGSPTEVHNEKIGIKFTALFDKTAEDLVIGSYRLSSSLIKKGNHINEYLLTISSPTSDCQVQVDHLFTVEDGHPFPCDNSEIMDFITSLIEYLHKEEHKVFIHCAAGLGRSGILAGVTYLGLNNENLFHKDNAELAKFIFEMLDDFNKIRPGTASGKKQMLSIIELFLHLYPKTLIGSS